jgi:hypothetical protein
MGFTRTAIQPTSKTLSADRSWKAATTKLQVVNDLLNSIGYYSLYMLKDGTLASAPYASVKSANAAVTYDTTDRTQRVKVLKSIKMDSTTDRIINKVVVVKDNASEAPIIVTKTNTNPQSPTSIPNLGVTIAKVINDSNIVDSDTALARATQALELGSMSYNRLQLTTSIDLEREPNETYTLNIVDAHGELVADGKWNCRGWTIGFTPSDGFMTHELSNVDEPPSEVL